VRLLLALVVSCGVAHAGELITPYEDINKPPKAGGSGGGNDFRWKVLFKADLNEQFNDAALNDFGRALALQRPGVPSQLDGQAAALAARANYLTSDHVLGTEGLAWSHLRTYFHGYLVHRFEGYGGQPSPTFPTAYLRGGQQTAYDVRSGYGEINGFKNEGFWSKVYLRAGRQFRYGAGIATFDGLHIGYQSAVTEVGLWGGRRSPRFLDDLDPGGVLGLDVKLHLEPLVRVPIDLALDYMMYAVTDPATGSIGVRNLLVVDGVWRIPTGGRLFLGVTSFDFGGFKGHLSFSHVLARTGQIKAYYDVKLGRDMTYDFISGFGFAPSRFFALPDILPRSRIGLRWDHAVGKSFEYALYASFNLVHGPGNAPAAANGLTGPTGFDATYEELGVILRAMAGTVFQPEAEYRIRFVQRQKETGLFSDSSESGERQFQELRTDMRIRPGGGFSLLFGMVVRVWDWVTRYAPTGQSTTVKNDLTAAGTAQAEVWVKRVFQLRLRYEVGSDSTVFAPELGVVNSLYATIGGRF
jgi:hypothetical protein